MFRLKAPIAPPVLRLPPPHRGALTGALSDAMKCLLSGDHEQLDRLELEYLNVLVRIGEFGVRYPDGEPYEFFGEPDVLKHFSHARRAALRGLAQRYQGERRPFVIAMRRGCGPAGKTLLVWQLATPCRRCEKLLRHQPCRVCNGTWYRDDDFARDDESAPPSWAVETDLDGVLVSEEID